MLDIAKASGFGKATVSLALRDDPRLRPETRRRIKEVAEKMGYRNNPTVANLMAQLRASREPKYQATLALLNACPHDGELRTLATFQKWLKGARDRAHNLGYEIDYFWLHEPGISAARLETILHSRNIRGMIFAAVFDNTFMDPAHQMLWNDFTNVAIGRKFVEPSPHYACNDQYDTALQAIGIMEKWGYSQVGLVILEETDGVVEYRFSAGYETAHKKLGKKSLPVHHFKDEADFGQWYLKHHPDAILTDKATVKDWLKKLPGGEQVGLAHLDWDIKLEGWAGMNQNNEQVGAAAVDILIGQLHRNESGLPPYPRSVMIGSKWVDGESLPKKNI